MATRNDIPESIDYEPIPDVDRTKISEAALSIVKAKMEEMRPGVETLAAALGIQAPSNQQLGLAAYHQSIRDREDQLNAHLRQAARIKAELDELTTEIEA